MAALTRYVLPSPTQLLSHILERRELVEAIRELPAPTLYRLIERIGIEDSAELIALASTEQIAALFDEDLWRSDESGFDTHFNPRRFALWLQVMGEAGDAFLVQRLCELPIDLLTLAVNRLVLVIDLDALRNFSAGARDELGQIEGALENALAEEWEEFCLIARDIDAWEEVWNALLLLDREHHARLRTILEQCCAMSLEYINGQGGLYDVLTSDEMLESDALAARDDRRASQGYVSQSDARAFLAFARDERQPLAQRDAITAGHFRALDALGHQERAASISGQLATTAQRSRPVQALMRLAAEIDAAGAQPQERRARLARVASVEGVRMTAPDQQATPRKHAQAGRAADTKGSGKPVSRNMETRSAGAEPTKSRPGSRARDRSARREAAADALTPGACDERPAQRPLLVALAALSSAAPSVHAARMEELAYLANVVIAGCKHEGRQLRPIEALEAAFACTNLGLELWARAEPERTVEGDVQLVRSVTCDRMFRLAWSTLQRDVVQVARATLTERCATLDAPRARRAHKLFDEQSPHGLRRLCAAHELRIAEESLELVLALAESLPRQPAADAQGRPTDLPWLATRDELERAQRFLAELAQDPDSRVQKPLVR